VNTLDKSLADKLRYKQGRAIVLNAPDDFNLGVSIEKELNGKFDFLQLFVRNFKELEEWVPQVVKAVNEEALFWICYPKQTSKIKTDVNRDIIGKMVQDNTEYRLVSNVAIDETWSALRLRLKSKVK
jgi:disulfide oxidoreductase YuzD